MVPYCAQFHKTIFAVFVIQRKSLPYKKRRRNNPKPDTEPLTDTCHIQNHEKDKDGKQSTGKEEEVLAFQPLELYRFADTFVDWIVCHDLTRKMNVRQ